MVFFLISHAAPSAYPGNFGASSIEPYSITLTWSAIECEHENGPIRGYVIRKHGSLRKPMEYRTVGRLIRAMAFTYGINPARKYVYSVAAYNDAGKGVFSSPLIVVTPNV